MEATLQEQAEEDLTTAMAGFADQALPMHKYWLSYVCVNRGDLVHSEAQAVYRDADLLKASRAWNVQVHGLHERYDDILLSEDATELLRALKMLARWWLRLHAWVEDGVLSAATDIRQRGRIPMRWFHDWIRQRLESPLMDLLRDVFSDLIFAQHVKVALIRFDGQVQRFRFTLGDEGIVETAEVGDKLGKHPVRMADRLSSFIGILCDVGVLEEQVDGRLFPVVQSRV